MFKLVKRKNNPISIKNHYERRNKILIKRREGGFGDILMQRMLFEDFSKIFPNAEFTFTCPRHYLEFAKNNPYCKTIDLGSIKEEEYGAIYDISTACRVHEVRKGIDNKEHRSDIWAKYCGVDLENHNMHITIKEDVAQLCKQTLNYYNPESKPSILLSTQSKDDNFGIAKSLTNQQITEIVAELKEKGYYLYTIHKDKQAIYDELGIDQFTNLNPINWLGMVNSTDYIISVDTATFHIAGGLKKPLVGVFTYTNGKVYGKYYDFILVQKHRDEGNWDCGPCYNVNHCWKEKKAQKPCLTMLSSDDILQGFDKAVKKWPFLKNNQKIEQTYPPAHTS